MTAAMVASNTEFPDPESWPRRGLDPESQAWLDQLAPGSPDRDVAVASLRSLLLSAARFEVNRRRPTVPHLRHSDEADLAEQSANDALLAVLRKLPEFRGDSRFTTWAYKFALLETAVKLRKLAWQGKEIPVEPELWPRLARTRSTPDQDVETAEFFAALRSAIDTELSSHQRNVLLAVAVSDVPIDVLAERLGSTRGALYKTMHDARRKLRSALAARGLPLSGYLRGTDR